jgi:glycosyltransferase involved in cell wall biosynthesis
MSASITVVIPTRNRLALLQEAIGSIEDQDLDAWSVIVVDDASDDDTPRWLADHTDPRISVIRLDRHGERTAARNLGLHEAQTPFVLFLDDDDRLQPHALARLLDALRDHDDAVASIGGVTYFDDTGRRQDLPHVRGSFKRTIWAESMFGWVAHTGRTLFRRSAVIDVGGFGAGLVVGEDRELLLRLSRRGPVVFVPGSVLDHRRHPGQWRPIDVSSRERTITEAHIATLPPDDQRLGRRILAASQSYERAYDAWKQERHRDALRAMAGLARAPRTLIASPLYRKQWAMMLMSSLAGSLFGARGVAALKRIVPGGRPDAAVAGWDDPSRIQMPDD